MDRSQVARLNQLADAIDACGMPVGEIDRQQPIRVARRLYHCDSLGGVAAERLLTEYRGA